MESSDNALEKNEQKSFSQTSSSSLTSIDNTCDKQKVSSKRNKKSRKKKKLKKLMEDALSQNEFPEELLAHFCLINIENNAVILPIALSMSTEIYAPPTSMTGHFLRRKPLPSLVPAHHKDEVESESSTIGLLASPSCT